MNPKLYDYMMDKMSGRNARRQNTYDYARGYDKAMQDMRDGRQGVKGTGRYGIGGRDHAMESIEGRDFERVYDRPYEPYERNRQDSGRWQEDGNSWQGDGNDYAAPRLQRRDYETWKRGMGNVRFTDDEVKHYAEKTGVTYRDYDEMDLCIIANALYSDYSDVLRKFIPSDKEGMAYVELAKAFLEDTDSKAKGREKVAMYFWTIVDDE